MIASTKDETGESIYRAADTAQLFRGDQNPARTTLFSEQKLLLGPKVFS